MPYGKVGVWNLMTACWSVCRQLTDYILEGGEGARMYGFTTSATSESCGIDPANGVFPWRFAATAIKKTREQENTKLALEVGLFRALVSSCFRVHGEGLGSPYRTSASEQVAVDAQIHDYDESTQGQLDGAGERRRI